MITTRSTDVLVIGAGAAGMAAAETVAKAGHSVTIIEREESTGGILLQCIHNGFGLHHFGQELTGPEYAETFSEAIREQSIEVRLKTTALRITRRKSHIEVVTASSAYGVTRFEASAVILAMGCRERNRGTIGTAGTRPSGVFTAGLAQRLLNIEGYVPGKRAVIVGSGDIGLIMARRLTWTGTKVEAVVEILPHPSGLTRNIVQCLEDFSIPLLLSHAVTRIAGSDRVEGVDIAPLVNGVADPAQTRHIPCDTLLFSVGLIPENELSRTAGVSLSADTGGPLVDHLLQTTVPGIFACGNVLHVHDLVDYVTEEAQRCGAQVAAYLAGTAETAAPTIPVDAGANLKYVTPGRHVPGKENHYFMRPLMARDKAVLSVSSGDTVLYTKRLSNIRPAEMLSVTLPASSTADADTAAPLVFSLK
jgi:NADPH-dependent 2,4-dienoyl-CoA reductase/sulfur reductase-like enzyme